MCVLTALFADKNGEIYDAPGYRATGRTGGKVAGLLPDDLIALPEGADLMYLPGRTALGIADGRLAPLPGQALAVAAILPAGYTRTHLPAFAKLAGAPVLPLYGYAAVALWQDELYVAAVASDDSAKWRPGDYNTAQLRKLVAKVRKELPGNRLVEQLAGCSLKWRCATAQNLFYRRWEAGIPASPVCNANCFGCISLQPAECCPSPQSRIDFKPTPREIAAVGIYHLSAAPEPIISFGQGCEGEPALAADNIAAGIRLIRVQTGRGQINMNTNAGYTAGIKEIVKAGLDTMRVSIISALPETYQAYYRSNYTLDDVKASIAFAKDRGIYVSLNMLSFPGLNDRPEEVQAWGGFLAETGVDMIQLRNLNVDPDAFLAMMPPERQPPLGVKPFLQLLQQSFPDIAIGSFSHFVLKNGQ